MIQWKPAESLLLEDCLIGVALPISATKPDVGSGFSR